jgi:hypothetical protein
MNPVVRGAVAGTAETILMSVSILASQRLGLVRTAPPVEISANVAWETDALPDLSRSAFSLLRPLSHLSYGAAGGVIYSLGQRFLAASTISAGLLFGGARSGLQRISGSCPGSTCTRRLQMMPARAPSSCSRPTRSTGRRSASSRDRYERLAGRPGSQRRHHHALRTCDIGERFLHAQSKAGSTHWQRQGGAGNVLEARLREES